MAETKESKNAKSYGAEQIQVLEGLDPVRKRPGMYIGGTGSEGLHHLIWEVVDNAIDEAMAGHCTEIRVHLLPGNRVKVEDNGRGIPVDIHKQYKVSALELVLTKLHAGGKFGGGGYKVSGGLHGVGVSVVNALSENLKAEVKREGKLWVQEYKKGIPQGKVKAVGNARGTGTTITFRPDATILNETVFHWQTIVDHLRQQAYLTAGVAIRLFDERDEKDAGEKPGPASYGFYFEGGIASYVRYLNHNKEKKHDTTFYVNKAAENMNVELAFQYTEEYKETTIAFANNIFNPEGGTHMVGFRTALTRVLNAYARTKGYLKEKEDNLSGEDVREGMTAVISIKIPDPQFEGQTKSKLGNPEVRPVVDTIFSSELEIFLEEHPREAEAIIGKCLLSARARAAAKAARETVLRKGVLEGMTLPGKLADCSSKDPSRCEIYIVEGDSAGGSAKQGRNREFQAILPLRGKVLNVERARLDKILQNNELRSLVIAMGTNIGEMFNIADLRYDRIILMTDADVDGAHIRTLLLTFFYRHFPALINEGHVYIAQPPLYRVAYGKVIQYAYSDEEKERMIQALEQEKGKKMKETGKKSQVQSPKPQDEIDASAESEGETMEVGTLKVSLQRYKGLGEMNPQQLWETTMDPAVRTLRKVTVDDAEKADQIFDILMGSEVEPRKRFIQTHAKAAKNLDV